MSVQAIERTKATRFQAGRPNHNDLYDGAVTIRQGHQDRGEKPHKYIRISKGVWKELQVHNWEKKNGQVPEGHVLACIDGDTLNCAPKNWKLITMAENMRRNSGSKNLPDSYVASLLAGRKHRHLKDEFLKKPDLIKTHRQVIILKRKIKNHETKRISTAK